MRTLQDCRKSESPARRTAIVARELHRYNIDIAALSETRFPDSGCLEEVGGGYTFFWQGRRIDESRESGVGFAVRSSLTRRLTELPRGISDRLMSLQLHLTGRRFVTVISVYAPTLSCEESVKASFYGALREVLRSTPVGDKIILLGDFNARVGSNWDTWSCLGKFGTGKPNSNGQLLLELCTEFDMYIASTHFQHKAHHLATWMHPRSKQWHLIDYVITRRRDRQDINDVRAMHGADAWTDHALVRCKLSFVIKAPARNYGVMRLPKRLDVSKLRSVPIQRALQSSISASVKSTTWENVREELYSAAKDVIGVVSHKNKDWFDAHDQEISQILYRKNKLRERLNHEHMSPAARKHLNQEFKLAKAYAQKRLREMEDNWWHDLADKMQAASDSRNMKEFHSLMKQVLGPKSRTVTPLRSKDGSKLLTSTADISERWREHFSELLNQRSDVKADIAGAFQQRVVVESLNTLPSLEEVTTAIGSLNTGKAAGHDGIFAEVFQHGGEHIAKIMHGMILDIWRDACVTKDWKNAILLPL